MRHHVVLLLPNSMGAATFTLIFRRDKSIRALGVSIGSYDALRRPRAGVANSTGCGCGCGSVLADFLPPCSGSFSPGCFLAALSLTACLADMARGWVTEAGCSDGNGPPRLFRSAAMRSMTL